MNSVALIGRLTRDPELKATSNNISVCSFTLAVDRRFKSEGQPTADFINCIAWRNTADFIKKYFTKGNKMAATGSIQTRSWQDQQGNTRYATEVIVDSVDFCESKRNDNPQLAGTEAGYNDAEDYYPVDEEGDIPF